MEYLTLLTLPILITVIWITALLLPHPPLPTNTPLLVLISHPDDEAMFFSPTLLSLTPAHLQNDIRVICLSTGNSSGLGLLRQRELIQSCSLLGVREVVGGAQAMWPLESSLGGNLGKVVVVEDEKLQDGMGVVWEGEYIAEVIQDILGYWSRMEEGEERWTPKAIVTFDKSGVSSHSNHISAYRGAKRYIARFSNGTKLYTLTTTSLLRKYLSILDYPFTYLSTRMDKGKSRFLFVLGPGGFKKARGAMTDAHVSQMRWFRWGWIWLSRYMVVNDLHEEDVLGADVGSGKGNVGGEKEL